MDLSNSSKKLLSLWRKFSLMAEPGCYGAFDPNDIVCMHCSRSTMGAIKVLTEEKEKFGKSFPPMSARPCEEESKEIKAQQLKLQKIENKIAEDRKTVEEMRAKLQQLETVVKEEEKEFTEQTKNFSEKLAFLVDQKETRAKYFAEENTPIPPTIISPKKVDTQKNTPSNDNFTDFMKMKKLILYTNAGSPTSSFLPRVGLVRSFPDTTLKDLAIIKSILPKGILPNNSNYPVFVKNQYISADNNLSLQVVVDFNGSVYKDLSNLSGQELIVELYGDSAKKPTSTVK